MSVASRQDVREDFAAILSTVMAEEAQTVTSDQPQTLDGTSPIVVVTSAGTGRAGSEGTKYSTFGGGSIPVFYLDIYIFVLTTAGADDTLDILEQQLAQAVTDNQLRQHWTAIRYTERSKTQFLEATDGKQYKFEVASLAFTGRS